MSFFATNYTNNTNESRVDRGGICVETTSFICGSHMHSGHIRPQAASIRPQTATEGHFFENPWDRPIFGCNSLNTNDLFVPFTRGTSVGQSGTETN